ncbi:MAG: hypothetical protein ACE5OQ_10435 [Woeseia sp.]
MTRVGIVVALAGEARTLGLRGHPSDEVVTLSHDVLVSVSGIGATRARRAGTRLLADGAEALLSWGSVVALDGRLASGRLLVPRSVLDGDRQPVPVSRGWQQQLYGQLAARFQVTDGPLITTHRLLTRPAQKRRLFADSGAVAADMESAEVAAVAHEAGVPFAALRAVADRADSNIPDWITGSFDAYGRVRVSSLLPPLISNPLDWLDVAGLAKDFRAATSSLRAVFESANCADLIPVMPAGEAAAIV